MTTPDDLVERIMTQHSETLEYLHTTEKHDELVKRVAQEIAKARPDALVRQELHGWSQRDYDLAIARAIIPAIRREALEEAARVADRNAAEAWNDPNAHDTRGLMRLQADDIAAAIRALKEQRHE